MSVSVEKQSGFSLIEVLIALVVISVGLLATARMQMEALRGSQGAYFSSQANFMIREMSDRMRANPQGVRDGNYDLLTTSSGAAASMSTCIETETVCTPSAIANADLATWSRYLHSTAATATGFAPLLPSGDTVTATGSVIADGATGSYTISVTWSERINGEEETRSMSVQVYP